MVGHTIMGDTIVGYFKIPPPAFGAAPATSLKCLISLGSSSPARTEGVVSANDLPETTPSSTSFRLYPDSNRSPGGPAL